MCFKYDYTSKTKIIGTYMRIICSIRCLRPLGRGFLNFSNVSFFLSQLHGNNVYIAFVVKSFAEIVRNVCGSVCVCVCSATIDELCWLRVY